MADVFLSDEASVQSSLASELLDIVLSVGTTYRIACGERDEQVVASGSRILYVATPAARNELVTPDAGGNGSKALEVTLPVTHPVVKRWFAYGVPPRQTLITMWRLQHRSGLREQIWTGLVTSISCSGNLAKLLVPARTIDTMQRSLPTISAGQSCPWTLYDSANCRIARASFEVATTAISATGRTVRVDLGDLAKNGDWSENGELEHVATGERMTIGKQADVDPGISAVTDLTIEQVIPELRTGDAVRIYAGCKKSVAVCLAKFNNVDNYGGSPNAPTRNPFLYTERLL